MSYLESDQTNSYMDLESILRPIPTYWLHQDVPVLTHYTEIGKSSLPLIISLECY